MFKYILILILPCIVFSSCVNDNHSSHSFLLINHNKDTSYYHFIVEDDSITQYSYKSDIRYSNINADSGTTYCLGEKVYTKTRSSNKTLQNIIYGNKTASILASIAKNNGRFPTSGIDIDTSYINNIDILIKTDIKRNQQSFKQCETKIINEISDSNCFEVWKTKMIPTIAVEEFDRISSESFREHCKSLQHKKVDLNEYVYNLIGGQNEVHNRYYLFDLFTYYCAPCIKTIPALNKLDQRLNIKVIGIHPFLKDTSRLSKFKASFKCQYKLLGTDAEFQYKERTIRSYPQYFLYDTKVDSIIQTWRGYHESFEMKVLDFIDN